MRGSFRKPSEDWKPPGSHLLISTWIYTSRCMIAVVLFSPVCQQGASSYLTTTALQRVWGHVLRSMNTSGDQDTIHWSCPPARHSCLRVEDAMRNAHGGDSSIVWRRETR